MSAIFYKDHLQFTHIMGTLAFFIILCLYKCLSGVPLDECDSPQYLEHGKTGTIRCHFARDFKHVFWYNSTETVSDAPIVTYSKSGKGGHGFKSGEFDVFPNGSLIITKVGLVHEHNYTVAKFVSLNDDPTYLNVSVIVFVKPVPAYPVVEGCSHQHDCVLEVDRSGNLTCYIMGIRPQVELEWKVTKDSYQEVSFSDSFYNISPSEGGKFNMTLISFFNITKTFATVECGVFGRGSDIFSELHSSVNLRPVQGIQQEEPSVPPSNPSNKQRSSLVLFFWIVYVIITSCSLAFHLLLCHIKRMQKKRRIRLIREISVITNKAQQSLIAQLEMLSSEIDQLKQANAGCVCSVPDVVHGEHELELFLQQGRVCSVPNVVHGEHELELFQQGRVCSVPNVVHGEHELELFQQAE